MNETQIETLTSNLGEALADDPRQAMVIIQDALMGAQGDPEDCPQPLLDAVTNAIVALDTLVRLMVAPPPAEYPELKAPPIDWVATAQHGADRFAQIKADRESILAMGDEPAALLEKARAELVEHLSTHDCQHGRFADCPEAVRLREMVRRLEAL